VLFGLNVAYFLQYGRTRTEAREAEEALPSVVDPGAVVSLVGLMAGRFEKGDALGACETATQLKIQQPIVMQMLEKLVAAGIVNRVQREDKEDAYALGRPADRIAAEDVLSIGEDLAGRPTETEGPIAAAMRKARTDLVRGKTIGQLLAGGTATSVPTTPQRCQAFPPCPAFPGPWRDPRRANIS
jgi:DNA-binding IscR family transcriptional regulator